MTLLKSPIVYLIFISALLLKVLTFIPKGDFYQLKSSTLVQKITAPKWKKRFSDLTKRVSRLKEKEGVDQLIYQTLCLVRDVPGFRTHRSLEAKWKALDQLITVLYLLERQSLTIKKMNGSETKPCYRLKNGSITVGFLKVRNNFQYEQACWDLSLLLEMDTFIAPSFSIEIEGVKYVFQPFFPCHVYSTIFTCLKKHSKRIKKIPQIEYWKANLFITLIGPEDLHAGNIGYTKNNSLFFFDNEHVFSPTNTFLNNSYSLTPPCMNHLFDWLETANPLTQKNASYVRKLLKRWKKSKCQIHAYLNHPLVPVFLTHGRLQALFDRFDQLTELTIQSEATTFSSIIDGLYPNLYDGLEELRPIIERITKMPLSPMSALHFLTSHQIWWDGIEKSDKEKMYLWVEKYHPNRRK